MAVALIVLVANLLGTPLEHWGQPRVIGEILGGIALGPSLLGALAPGLQQALFGQAVRPQLNLLSQLGLGLFIFLIGLELNRPCCTAGYPWPAASPWWARPCAGPGVVLSELLEHWLRHLLHGDHNLAGGLFMDIAIAIPPFPVLVRILQERGLIGQPLETLKISVAAIDDLVR